ncbi:UDP-N-acetylmuramate dehydrogenase [Rhodohalobacter mucosus]|uniref:UDP-N-acetylenolpyruvoylglucosamine reductase n=1 Tax=Rhodohalobacter mucosus TaxID=2079485 RepID=A0A316TSD1_9BACT|nr:UDP-N-acetylmuramate dehydrogenase [Rhodohalobacter mucosus]PWN06239.1 UDP-N-acetylenolpyruvoylglucosamine reductase [Rhodohalobacter mucosus]
MKASELPEKGKPKIKHRVSLRPFNTLSVEATAETFIEILEKEDLQTLYREGFFRKFDPFILGGGSNVLFRDNPSRPVLKISLKGIDIVAENDSSVQVRAGAGDVWHDLVEFAVQRGYGGIENLALIPGTVGAAPIQNIGAYGSEIEQVFSSLEFFDVQEGTFRSFTREECHFGYRDSIFKRDLRGRAIVTSVTLNLTKKDHNLITDYYSLTQRLREKGIEDPGIRDIFDAVVFIRKSKLPDPKEIGNAGSFFKNPVIPRDQFKQIQRNHPDIPFFEAAEGYIKVPAGWLIEQCEWKGKKVGKTGTYEHQALVIVNHGSASGKEIYQLAERIQSSVFEKFGIALTPEVNIVG